MVPDAWKKFLASQRTERESQQLNRKLRPMRRLSPTRLGVGSREFINFAGNDYLGLAGNLRIAEAAASAAGRFGWGAGASRLVTGTSSQHARLEAETALFRGTDAALVFGSGYQANLGVITALAGPGDTVFSDALNHASIVAGCRLSGATVKVFQHRDYNELERKLNSAGGGRLMVVTDSLFSIMGDAADLPRIVKLCQRFNALLVVDDAHGNAALGKRGRGVPEVQGVLAHVDVLVGTYSKALGSYGGFVACDNELRDHLLNRARPFIYTTAMPMALAAANLEALRIMREDGDALRATLASNARMLRSRLVANGFEPTGEHHIVGIQMASPSEALFYAEQLEESGVIAWPMRWPSVPEGKDALRISVSAAHSEEDLKRLVTALKLTRDRTVGKETSGINKRSARRPSHASLEAAEEYFEIEETGFSTEDDSHPALDEPILAVDSDRLPNAADLEEIEQHPMESGGTVIIQPMHEVSQPEAQWPAPAEPDDNPPEDAPDDSEEEAPKEGAEAKVSRRTRRRERKRLKQRSKD